VLENTKRVNEIATTESKLSAWFALRCTLLANVLTKSSASLDGSHRGASNGAAKERAMGADRSAVDSRTASDSSSQTMTGAGLERATVVALVSGSC
jgi:hypothetical protein